MLTPAQSRAMRAIIARQADGGVSPTVRELMEATGVKSPSGAHRVLKSLEERGFIRRLPRRARAIEVLKTV